MLHSATALTLLMALYIGAVTANSALVLAFSEDPSKAFRAYLPAAGIVVLLLIAAFGTWRKLRWAWIGHAALVVAFAEQAIRRWPATLQFLDMADGSGAWTYVVILTPYLLLPLSLYCAVVAYWKINARR